MLQLLGWLGTVLYLFAHFLQVKASYSKRLYFFINCVAAIFVLISSIGINSLQPVAVNGFWFIVSLFGFFSFQLPKLPTSNFFIWIIVALIVLLATTVFLMHGSIILAFDVLGWGATIVFSVAYWKYANRRISKLQFNILNIYAAISLLPILWNQLNYQVFFLEVIWALISVYTIFEVIESER